MSRLEAGTGGMRGGDPEALKRRSLARQALLWVVLGQVALHGGMAGQRMATPLQALDAGRPAWTVGVLLGLYAAMPVLTAMPVGRLVDHRGYLLPQRLAASLVVLGTALALASSWLTGMAEFTLQCLAASASGVGAHMGLIVMQRTAGQLSSDSTERLRIFGWLGLAPPMANMAGPVLAGLAIDQGGFALAYGLMLALPVVSLLVAGRVPPEMSVKAAQAAQPAQPAQPIGAGRQAQAEAVPARAQAAGGRWGLGRGRLAQLWALPGMRRLMLVNWMLAAAWDVHSFAVPVLGHERGFAASTIGFVLGAFTAAITLVRLMVPFVAHRISETAVLGGAMVGVALAFVVYPLAPTALAMGGCAVLLGLALGGVQPMIMNVLHLLTPTDRQGEALGLRSMSINLSSSIMPLLFGAVGTAAGPAVLFWLVGALVGGGSLTVRGLGPVLRDARRREAELDRPAEPEPGPEPGQNPATDSSRVRT